MMFSRIYLGVHSPADVVAGSLVGCLTLSAWLHYDDILDRATAVSGQGTLHIYSPFSYVSLIAHLFVWWRDMGYAVGALLFRVPRSLF